MGRGCITAVVLALPLLGACKLLPLGRTPPPRVSLATVGDPDPPAPAAPSPPDDEPELVAADDHEDDEPEGLPPAADGVAAASQYAALDRATCEGELRHRKIAFTRVEEARGVVAPVRLDGPLGGSVKFRSNLPSARARVSPYDVYDCRLVLALDDFAHLLAKHDVVEVVHLSVWRPVSSKTVLKGPGRRHSGALAIDAAIFKRADGTSLSVLKDFHGRIGARPCPAPESASELRKIACEANQARLFNVLLTPDYNWAHRNHFHLEVTAGVKWTFVR
ncbi:MAG: extensin family protein [Labilithrix sp.]|nr:extensin family protein [Labilithrix sp.]MCW5812726.1 extensin family protein [Labilithrix sp.]